MLFMLIEHFRGGDPEPVYRRLEESGRQFPEGLSYVGSWVTEDLSRCYQVMKSPDRALLDTWMAHWEDLTRFEVVPVLSSAEATDRVRLRTPPP